MAKLKILITAFLCCLSVLVCRAEGGGEADPETPVIPDPTPVTTPLFPPSVPSTRPNAPSHVYIECTYVSGYVRLGFPQGIYSATVTITNGEEEWFGFASIDEPVMETPVFSGDYTIECVADNGRLFTGTLHF